MARSLSVLADQGSRSEMDQIMDDVLRQDATAQAQLIASRQISPLELLEAAIARADATQGSLNAIPIRFDDKARAQAAGPLTGPLAGVPFLLKDLAQDYAGERTTRGATALAGQVANRHSHYTQRCLDAGLVIFGRTATPEYGLRPQTESVLWGPTRNPWDTDRTPGGSSGGSAAAVAAGVVALAGANDGGGSIRIPASYCGLFGLKPSRGRVSWGPQSGDEWEGASCNGVLTRSVRDSAAMLDIISAPCPGDPVTIASPPRAFADYITAPPARLRIGYSVKSPVGATVDPAQIAAIDRMITILRDLGHEVEEAAPAIDGQELAKAFLTMYLGQVAADAATSHAAGGKAEPDTEILAWFGRGLASGAYAAARRQWNGFARAQAAFHHHYACYLTPVVAGPPPVIGALAVPPTQMQILKLMSYLPVSGLLLKAGVLDKIATDNLAQAPFTQMANLTGTPSMSVPVATDGLPIGAQFTAGFGEEGLLLQLAAQIEQAAPWPLLAPLP